MILMSACQQCQHFVELYESIMLNCNAKIQNKSAISKLFRTFLLIWTKNVL